MVETKKHVNLDALERGRLEYQRKIKAGEIVRMSPLEKAHANPKSLRRAINGACYECVGCENWHNRTRYCQIFTCSLWNVRQGGKGITQEECLGYTEE